MEWLLLKEQTLLHELLARLSCDYIVTDTYTMLMTSTINNSFVQYTRPVIRRVCKSSATNFVFTVEEYKAHTVVPYNQYFYVFGNECAFIICVCE